MCRKHENNGAVCYNRGTPKYTTPQNAQFAPDLANLSNLGLQANQWGLCIWVFGDRMWSRITSFGSGAKSTGKKTGEASPVLGRGGSSTSIAADSITPSFYSIIG